MTTFEVFTETLDEPVVYSSTEIVELTGISYRRLDYWCNRGYLPETAEGSGTQRRFDKFDLALIQTAALLQTVDVPVEKSFQIATLLLAGREHRVVFGDAYELIIRPITKADTP